MIELKDLESVDESAQDCTFNALLCCLLLLFFHYYQVHCKSTEGFIW